MLIKHSVTIRGHRTSYSLENEFYQELQKLAELNNRSITSLITKIDKERAPTDNLSSAIRVYLLRHIKALNKPV